MPKLQGERNNSLHINLDEISMNWSKENDYPLDDSNQLSHVSQFMAIHYDNNIFPKTELSDILTKIEPPDFSLDKYANTPYSVLTELKLPIYITTNYDHFMESALISSGRQPVSDFCRWNADLLNDKVYANLSKKFNKVSFPFSDTKLTSILEQSSDYKPTENRPLVYHLYGDISIPQSMVLTEKDYFDFVINLHTHQDTVSLPSFILNALATSSLLFIGYNLEDIGFRSIFQGFISLQTTNLRPTSIAVHIPPDVHKEKAILRMKYLSSYTQNFYKLNIHWGNIDEFVVDLKDRWKKYRTEK